MNDIESHIALLYVKWHILVILNVKTILIIFKFEWYIIYFYQKYGMISNHFINIHRIYVILLAFWYIQMSKITSLLHLKTRKEIFDQENFLYDFMNKHIIFLREFTLYIIPEWFYSNDCIVNLAKMKIIYLV